MKTAIVTGASSGIGEAIAKRLLEENFTVLGIARHFETCIIKSEHFIRYHCDLMDINELQNTIREIKKTHTVDVLINNAGIGHFGLHEELNAKKIHAMIATNLEAPLILCNEFLRQLKKNHGHIIQIASITANEINPHGCAYGATKAALLSFSKSLFYENRKYGLKVTTILPDMTQSHFYDHADFMEGESLETFLTPDEVADAVIYALNKGDHMVVSEITLQPQKHQIRRR